MKKLHAGMGLLLAGLLVVTAGAQRTPQTIENPKLVVGTFDSRAIAMAYIRSEATGAYLNAQKADVDRLLERARAEGDRELETALEALGPAMQKRIHQQGFGTAPVDDILARIEDRLPDVAEAAGVDVIVSKWVLTYRSPDARFVDVTDLLVAEFDPDEKTLEGIHQLVATAPVPLDQLTEEH